VSEEIDTLKAIPLDKRPHPDDLAAWGARYRTFIVWPPRKLVLIGSPEDLARQRERVVEVTIKIIQYYCPHHRPDWRLCSAGFNYHPPTWWGWADAPRSPCPRCGR
jgi:hypothetical protein